MTNPSQSELKDYCRAAVDALKKYNYEDLEVFIKTAVALNSQGTVPLFCGDPTLMKWVMDIVVDRSRWHELIFLYDSHFLGHVRRAIYEAEGIDTDNKLV